MVGERIRALLAEKKISQAELARKLGVTPAGVNGWVKGTREPDLATIFKIAEALGVPMSDLIAPMDALRQAVDHALTREANKASPSEESPASDLGPDSIQMVFMKVIANLPKGVELEDVRDYEESPIQVPQKSVEGKTCYALRNHCNHLAPEFRPGDAVVITKDAAVETGRIVVVRSGLSEGFFLARYHQTGDAVSLKIDTPEHVMELKAPLRILGRVILLNREY